MFRHLRHCSIHIYWLIMKEVCVYLPGFHPGPSSDSDVTSLAVDTDSLTGLDDGMASGRTSPNQPQRGATNISSSSSSPLLPSLHNRRTPSPAPAPNSEVNWPGRTLFSGSLKKVTIGSTKEVKSDYLDRASELISLAVQKEKEQDFQAAFSCYRSGVDLLLQGVQGQFRRELGNICFREVPIAMPSKINKW